MNFISTTNVGLVKNENQDSKGYAESTLGTLFAICDGISGLPNGKLASNIAITSILDNFSSLSTDADNILKHVLDNSQQAVMNSKKQPLGTTVVSCLIKNLSVHVGWCGDSRIYHISNNAIVWMSTDHNILHDILNKGCGQDIIYKNPKALNRYYGRREIVHSEYFSFNVNIGDYILLCSDGLSDFIAEQEIINTITNNEIKEASNILESKLLSEKTSAPDNFTWFIIQID